MLRTLFVFAVSTILVGCVSTGNEALKNETEASVEQKLTEGQTKKSEVKKMFGSPMSTSFTSAGDEMWSYQFSKMQADAINFVPYVGLFGSSASGEQKQMVVLFDKRDVVKRYSMTSSDVTAKTGLFQ